MFNKKVCSVVSAGVKLIRNRLNMTLTPIKSFSQRLASLESRAGQIPMLFIVTRPCLFHSSILQTTDQNLIQRDSIFQQNLDSHVHIIQGVGCMYCSMSFLSTLHGGIGSVRIGMRSKARRENNNYYYKCLFYTNILLCILDCIFDFVEQKSV